VHKVPEFVQNYFKNNLNTILVKHLEGIGCTATPIWKDFDIILNVRLRAYDVNFFYLMDGKERMILLRTPIRLIQSENDFGELDSKFTKYLKSQVIVWDDMSIECHMKDLINDTIS
jgi:hypothetical protein